MNYQTAAEKLGKRAARKIANNTYLVRRGDVIAIRLHSTDVVTMRPDGSTTLNSGGWATSTTKDRLGLVCRISQRGGLWYVTVDGKEYLYRDGMTITKRGAVRGAGKSGSDTKAKAWKAKVSRYADTFVDRLLAGKIPAPSGGDCWHCAMVTAEGNSLGEASHSDHIREHVKEGYYVPSMLNNLADRLSPIARQDVGYLLGLHDHKPSDWSLGITRRQIRSALRRYVGTHTGIAIR